MKRLIKYYIIRISKKGANHLSKYLNPTNSNRNFWGLKGPTLKVPLQVERRFETNARLIKSNNKLKIGVINVAMPDGDTSAWHFAAQSNAQYFTTHNSVSQRSINLRHNVLRRFAPLKIEISIGSNPRGRKLRSTCEILEPAFLRQRRDKLSSVAV